MGPKANEFGQITPNSGHTPFKVTWGHRFWYQWKFICDFLL